jgi:hypothetical protein
MATKLPAKQSDAPNSYHTHRHSHADFTYSIQRHVISITDLNLGNRSVTNDIEYVLQQIEYYHQSSITSNRIMYRDSDGIWDGIHWNGQQVSFFPLREKDEGAAREKLLKHQRHDDNRPGSEASASP